MTDTSAPTEDASVTFNVKASSGPKVTFTLPLTTLISDLKTKLAEPDSVNVPIASQRLIYSGKVLKDHETLATYNVKEGNTMHLVRSAPSNQRQDPAASSTPSTVPQPTPSAVPQNFAAGTGHDPLNALTGARYAGYNIPMPSMEQLANPPSQEEMLRQMEDPNFIQQLNEAMNNPQMIDMLVNSSPQFRAMGPQAARQILQSPGFRRMMTDPQALRSMMQMQRAMGGNPFGGMGGGDQDAFPMPGATNTTDPQHQNQGQNQQPQNPFGNMFGGGGMGGGMNPFMFMPPPPTGQDRSADPTVANQQANPFAAMFNPAMFGQPSQTTGQTGNTTDSTNNTTGTTESTQQPQQTPNLFAAMQNPMMQQMMQQMMQNPDAMRQATQAAQAMMGGAGGAGAGGFDPFAMFGGGSPAPPDNRPPEERFATQLRQLNEMGFYDFDRNVQALNRSGGDVNGALEWLFSQPQS